MRNNDSRTLRFPIAALMVRLKILTVVNIIYSGTQVVSTNSAFLSFLFGMIVRGHYFLDDGMPANILPSELDKRDLLKSS